MAESRQNIMEKAETRFLETQKKTADRAKATVEYQTEAKLRATKTARLRELRLPRTRPSAPPSLPHQRRNGRRTGSGNSLG